MTSQIEAAFAAQRCAFEADRFPGLATRVDRLRRLADLTSGHEAAVADAISEDFGHRSSHETAFAEIFVAAAAIGHARRHLRRWMKPRRAHTALHFRPGYGRVMRQPLGVIGIISPWNYPFQLAICPAAAALAAGNRVMLKPSEQTPRFSALLAAIVAEHFDANEMTVITGDAEAGKAFARLPFDHLLFTGSTTVGREVAVAAARNLTPVTLELGGKSPAIVDSDAHLPRVADRIVIGKLLNAGQTCIAPDYALIPHDRIVGFCRDVAAAVRSAYPTLAANPDYTSIVSERRYRRLLELGVDAREKGAQVLEINPAGETLAPRERKLVPTLVVNARGDMDVMREEVFGPILPIVGYRDLDEAIAFVNARPRPLSLYYFGETAARRDRVLAQTISGGVTVNDTLWHYVQEDMPFGGVGASGHGVYHGEHGFRTFSKEKPVFTQRPLSALGVLRPPYGKRLERVLGILRRFV
jgi:coniferyl-aldehyde dehydrogenase